MAKSPICAMVTHRRNVVLLAAPCAAVVLLITGCIIEGNPAFSPALGGPGSSGAGMETGSGVVTSSTTAMLSTTDGTDATSGANATLTSDDSATTQAATSESASSSGSVTTSETETTGTPPTYADLVLEDGPVAYWRLGEAFSAEVTDEMGSYPGTYQSVDYGEPGAIYGDPDTAIGFYSGGKALFGDVFDFVGLAPMTLEAWIRPTTINSSWPVILSKDLPEGQGWRFAINDYDGLSVGFLRWRDSQNDGVFAPIPFNEFSHVVMNFDGVTMRMYVNGEQIQSYVTDIEMLDTTVPVAMGGNATDGSTFPGVVDEVAVYDYALPPARIVAHYQMGTTGS